MWGGEGSRERVEGSRIIDGTESREGEIDESKER